MSTVTECTLSYSKIRKLSSDQKILPLATSQPKLPVWLNRWASAKYISLCRSTPSICFCCSNAVNRSSRERRRESAAARCAELRKVTKSAASENRIKRGSSAIPRENKLPFRTKEFIGGVT